MNSIDILWPVKPKRIQSTGVQLYIPEYYAKTDPDRLYAINIGISQGMRLVKQPKFIKDFIIALIRIAGLPKDDLRELGENLVNRSKDM